MSDNTSFHFLIPTMKSLDSNKNASKADADEAPAANDNNGFFTPNEKINFSNVKIEPLFEEAVDFDTFSKSDFRAVKVKECVAVPKSKKLLQFTLDDGTGTDRTILSGIHSYYEPEELVGKTLIAITNLPPRKMMGIESCGMLLSAVNNLKDSEDEELHLLMVDNHIPAVNFCKTVNLILEENIMDKNYKPITSMKEVPEQLRKLRRQYLRYQQAEIIYSISHKKLFELASDAGAIYRIDGTVLINRDIFDAYLE